MTDKAERNRATVACWPAGVLRKLAGEDLLYDEDEDFDMLLAASSFGSAQARAIRDQVPDADREHARRVVEGEELCEPLEGDIDDAVGELVYGMAHAVAPESPTAGAQDGWVVFVEMKDGWLERGDRSWASRQLLALNVCQSNLLWPDHRASLLQSLVDHDAFDGLRPDVAWKIVDTIFDVPRPPRVLSRCFEKVVVQLDVSGLAAGWLLEPAPEHRDVLSALWCEGMIGHEMLWVANTGMFGGMSALEPPPRLPALTATAPPDPPVAHPPAPQNSATDAPAPRGRDGEGGRRRTLFITTLVLVGALMVAVTVRFSGVWSLLRLGGVVVAAVVWLLRATRLLKRGREERHIESAAH